MGQPDLGPSWLYLKVWVFIRWDERRGSDGRPCVAQVDAQVSSFLNQRRALAWSHGLASTCLLLVLGDLCSVLKERAGYNSTLGLSFPAETATGVFLIWDPGSPWFSTRSECVESFQHQAPRSCHQRLEEHKKRTQTPFWFHSSPPGFTWKWALYSLLPCIPAAPIMNSLCVPTQIRPRWEG